MRKLVLIILTFIFINGYGVTIYEPFSNTMPSQTNHYQHRHPNTQHPPYSNCTYAPYSNSGRISTKSVSRDNGTNLGGRQYKEKTTSDGYTIYYQKGNGSNPSEIWIVDSNGNIIKLDEEDMNAFFNDPDYRNDLINGSENTYQEYLQTPIGDGWIMLLFLLVYLMYKKRSYLSNIIYHLK